MVELILLINISPIIMDIIYLSETKTSAHRHHNSLNYFGYIIFLSKFESKKMIYIIHLGVPIYIPITNNCICM